MTGTKKKTQSPQNVEKLKKQQSSLAANKKTASSVKPISRYTFIALIVIILISFIAYLPALHNGFINWDDDKYIQNDPLIYSLNLKDLFSQYAVSNYHPLTMLTYAMEYHFFGLSEKGFHAVNLLFH